MHIWLVKTGEEMPIDGPQTRLLRTGLLARELVARGHRVTFWNAAFNHQKKLQRFGETTRVAQADGYDAVFLQGRPYDRNISVGRIRSHRENARAFRNAARDEPAPDAILCSFPTIELAAAVEDYARPRGVPYAIDCRDMWPEIISARLGAAGRVIGAPLIGHWTRERNRAMAGATAITGVSNAFVEWGCRAAGRAPGPFDRAFHLTVAHQQPDPAGVAAARAAWAEAIPGLTGRRLVCGFAGSLSDRVDLGTVLDGLDLLDADERGQVAVVLCGKGDREAEIRRRAAANAALHFGGWRNATELAGLLAGANLGLLPYPNSDDFLSSYPNKVGEYLLAGLPILTGLEGLTGALLDRHDLRLAYQAGSAPSFAAAIRAALANPPKPEVRERALTVGREQFDPVIIYRDFAAWTESLPEFARARPPAAV